MHICPRLTSVIRYSSVLLSAFLVRHSSFVLTVIVHSEKIARLFVDTKVTWLYSERASIYVRV